MRLKITDQIATIEVCLLGPVYNARIELMAWNVLKRTYVVDKPWLKVRRDDVIANGVDLDYYIVEEKDGIMVAGLTDDQKLIFVKQYKPAVDKVVIEFPSGYIEKADQSHEHAALRELLEETGYQAKSAIHLASTFRSPGRYTQTIHLCFAKNLVFKPDLQKLDSDEEIEVLTMTLSEAFEAITSRKIQDLATVASIFLVKSVLEK